jgi:hypothetical protein
MSVMIQVNAKGDITILCLNKVSIILVSVSILSHSDIDHDPLARSDPQVPSAL